MASFDKKNLFFTLIGLIVLSLCSYIIGYQLGFKSWGKQISISLDPAFPVRGLASASKAVRNTASVSHEEYANPQNFFDKAKVLENGILEENVIPAENVILEENVIPAENVIPEENAIPAENVIPAKAGISTDTSSEPAKNDILEENGILEENVIPAKAGIQHTEDSVSFVTGNLLYTDEKGNTSFVCNTFSQVQFLFSAFGIAMSGEKVIMKITTNCTANEDSQYIGPFTIPAKKILESPIVENKFSEGDTTFEFENISLSWPRSWILIRANFKKDGMDDFSVISKQPETEDDLFIIEF